MCLQPNAARHATCVRDDACVHVCVCVCLPLHQVLDTGGTLIDALTLAAYAALNNARYDLCCVTIFSRLAFADVGAWQAPEAPRDQRRGA